MCTAASQLTCSSTRLSLTRRVRASREKRFGLDVFAVFLLFFPVVVSQSLNQRSMTSLSCDFVAAGEALGGRDGLFITDVLLPFHSSYERKARECKGFRPATALQDVEAVRLAFDLVENSSLLGNLCLGYDIVDTCSNVYHVVEFAKYVERSTGNEDCEVSCKSFHAPQTAEKSRTVKAKHCHLKNAIHDDRGRNGHPVHLVVGIAESEVAEAIIPVFRDARLPVLSHAASSQSLLETQMNAKTKDYFFRVIPEDGFEVKGLVALLQHFQWTHIAAFWTRTSEYASMFSTLRKEIGFSAGNSKGTTNERCIAIQGKYSIADTYSVELAAKQLASVPHIHVVIAFGNINDTLALVEHADMHHGLMDRLVWFFSSKWGRELLQLPRGHPNIVWLRRIKYGIFLEPVPAFDPPDIGRTWDAMEVMLSKRLQKLSPDTNDENFNPWFNKAWNAAESRGKCSELTQTSSSGEGPLEPEGRSSCRSSPILGTSLLLMEACFQAARAIHAVVTGICHLHTVSLKHCDLRKKPNYCPVEFHIRQQLINENITGDKPDLARYRINFFQREFEKSAGVLDVVRLGHWSPAAKVMFTSKTQEMGLLKTLKSVKSFCPLNCKAGETQSLDYVAYARRCCWKECHPCTGRTVSRLPDSEVCEECNRGQRPNGNHTACQFFQLTKTADLVSSAFIITFSTVGSVLTILTIILFHKHHDTFIVKTADITLSTVMLSFQLLSFLSVSLLLAEPSKNICISQVFLVLIWPVLYVGCILIKTNRLRVLFRRTGKLTKHRLLLLSNQTQAVFVSLVGVFTAIFLTVWVVVSTPYRDIVYSPDSIDYTCHRSNTWMGVYFSGVLSLLVASLVLSFQARNLPSDFNEASFLLLSTCSVTFLWIILIPAYYESTSIKPDTLLALIITGQGIVTLLCLFTRRLYYIARPRSEEEMKSRKRLSTSVSRTRMTVMSRGASSASLRSHASEYNRSSIAETPLGSSRPSEYSDKDSCAMQQSKDFISEAGATSTTDPEL